MSSRRDTIADACLNGINLPTVRDYGVEIPNMYKCWWDSSKEHGWVVLLVDQHYFQVLQEAG